MKFRRHNLAIDERDDERALGAYQTVEGVDMPSLEIQHIWFELARSRPWRSVALVPVEENHSTLAVSHEMAEMAALDPRQRVLLVNATGIPGSERVNVPQQSSGQVYTGPVPMANARYHLLDCAKLGYDDATVGLVELPKLLDDVRTGTGQFTLLIVATAALVTRPAAVPIARSVDAVAICTFLGMTRFLAAKRTIDLIGEDRIVGSIALRPRRKRRF